MALYGKTVTKREVHWILSLKGENLVLLNYRLCLAIHLSDFTHVVTYSYIAVNRN